MLNVVVDTLSIRATSGGIRVYLRELLKAAEADSTIRFTLICSASNAAAFAGLPVHRQLVIPWRTLGVVARILTQQLLVPLLVARLRPSLLFAPVDVAPLLAPAPVITCMHSSHLNAQLGYAGFFKRFYARLFLHLTILRSRRILAISRYVQDSTEQMFAAARGKICVVYHGGGIIEQARRSGWTPPDDASRQGGILFVGTLHRHKRADTLLRAYARLQRETKEALPPLSIVGFDPRNAGESLRRLALEQDLRSQLILHGRVDDCRLLELYAQARVLVFPSEVEGFGLPVIEAMQAGLPVVIANRCALPEIAGDAALQVNPDDTQALAAAIADLLWNPQRRHELISQGLVRGEQFSWARCARETLAELRRAARQAGD